MLRSPDGPVRFDHNADSLAGFPFLNLTCASGDFDLAFRPGGIAEPAYETLMSRSVPLEVAGVPTVVAHMADVIRSKQAAGRDKDWRVLPIRIRFARNQGINRLISVQTRPSHLGVCAYLPFDRRTGAGLSRRSCSSWRRTRSARTSTTERRCPTSAARPERVRGS